MTPQQLNSLPFEKRFRLFTQWLGNQPEKGRYVFSDTSNCAMCQFAKKTLDTSECVYVGAGAHEVSFVFRGGGSLSVQLVPLSGFQLLRNCFGSAYNGYAKQACLPRRKPMNRLVAWFCSRFLKHKNALAA